MVLSVLAALPLGLLAGWVAWRERCSLGATLGAIVVLASLAIVSCPGVAAETWPALAGSIGVLGVACVVDIREKRLPDPLTLGGYPLLLIALFVSASVLDTYEQSWRAVAAGLVSLVFFFAIGWVSSGRFGLGDVKLSLTTGSILGWFGWNEVLVGHACAFVLFAVAGMASLLLRRDKVGSELPFGPCMVLGALLGPVCSTLIFG